MRIDGILKKYDRLAIFVDYDGTIVPLKGWEPHKSKPDAELIRIVRELSRIPYVQLTIISGRNFNELNKYFPIKGIFVAGAYGGIIRDRVNKIYYLVSPSSIRYSLSIAKRVILSIIRKQHGFVFEDKLVGFALHYGQAYHGAKDKVFGRISEFFERFALKGDFNLFDWRSSVELVHKAVSKGNGVKYILENLTPPYYYPVYFGDDITDRYALEPINEASGSFFFVGENIESVDEVRAFLKAVIQKYRGTGAYESEQVQLPNEILRKGKTGFKDILKTLLEVQEEEISEREEEGI